jgi:hypothetical protein
MKHMDHNNFVMSYSVDSKFESDKFVKIRCRVCHDEESPNKTYFTKETMEKANKESLEYIPILAHVYVDENGKPVIGSHDMHIEEDKLNEGETRVIYDEQPIGMVPSLADNNCTIEEYNGLNYTFVDAYIWRDYSNYAEQLVEDAENTKMSMEIDFPEDALSYDTANERYNISSYRYRGITLLNEALGTGMKDALVTTANFSINEDVKSKMIVLMEELQKCLRDYNENAEEKGDNTDMNNEGVVETVVEETVKEVAEETVEEVVEEVAEETMEEDNEAVVEESAAVTTAEEPAVEEFVENEPLVCTFRISHDDTRYALQNLLNSICGENQFLYIESVYDGYFYYADYFTGDAYKQEYKVRKDVVSFSGDPERVYREFVTQAEKDELENMRKNYAALVKFKADTEAAQLQAQKDAVFAKEEFAGIVETKAFKNLVENSKDYTVEECERKAKDILDDCNDYVTNFAAKDDGKKRPKTVGFNFAKDSKKRKAYGSLFD